MRKSVFFVVFMVFGVVMVQAQAPQSNTSPAKTEAAAPSLTDVQKLQLQNLAQSIELAQLRAQVAQAEFDKARLAIGELVKTLQKDGYDLDLQTLTYVPKKPIEPKK